MINANGAASKPAQMDSKHAEAQRVEATKDRVQEMVDYRDAGVISDAELEEQKAKLRWGIGP